MNELDYNTLESIVSQYRKICIWGFGRSGKSYVFMSLVAAKAENICFCDRNYRIGVDYFSCPLISKDELFREKSVFVFVAVYDLADQKSISDELCKQGIPYRVFDRCSFSTLCESIDESGDNQLKTKYNDILDDEEYIKNLYRLRVQKELNLDDPRTLNEKIQWLKIHDKNPLYPSIADKYEVKKYISNALGSDYSVPTIGIWEQFEDIDFSKLPQYYVLKCTHDNSSVFLSDDRDDSNLLVANDVIERGLHTNFFWICREWPYKSLQHNVIAEPLLRDDNATVNEYKFMCFNGQAYFFWVRSTEHGILTRNFYDMKRNEIAFSFGSAPKHSNIKAIKESFWTSITQKINKLASEFKHVRIDTYIMRDHFYVGEITLYTGSGLDNWHPYYDSVKYGDLIQL